MVEASLQRLSSDIGRLKVSGDQSKLSDLVLLERLQKTEKILGESLSWIRQVANAVIMAPTPIVAEPALSGRTPEHSENEPAVALQQVPTYAYRPPDPSVVQPGSLNSITTPTELQVLTLLANEGPKSAPEIGRFVGRSREHSARLMKKLFDEGYVRRDQTRVPFRYSTVERVKNSFTKSATKGQEQGVASAPEA